MVVGLMCWWVFVSLFVCTALVMHMILGKYNPHDPKRKSNMGAIYQKDIINEFAK